MYFRLWSAAQLRQRDPRVLTVAPHPSRHNFGSGARQLSHNFRPMPVTVFSPHWPHERTFGRTGLRVRGRDDRWAAWQFSQRVASGCRSLMSAPHSQDRNVL
jgi:hypothetical protein